MLKTANPVLLISAALTLFGCKAKSVNPDITQTHTEAKLIGVIAPKGLSETHNDLTIGCETLDRDYADYHQYKEYLSQLGIRKIRLQAGWAKTEKVKGVYDFAWLDSIIDDAVSRGLEPWLETSYGNPIYEGGGAHMLFADWPTSEEALSAWDRWVEAMAVRYKGKVHEWEIWNEPDLNKSFREDPRPFVDLTIRTAEIIRRVDPEAKIAGFAWAVWRPKVFMDCMGMIRDAGKLHLLDWITYHFYPYRPEDMYKNVESMRDSLRCFSSDIVLRQGESGAPSKGHLGGALSKYDWTEVSQAKWDLRRMVSDRGRDIPSTVFCISDMNYFKGRDTIKTKNVKGLLETDDDNRVIRPKQAFFAVQNLVSVWNQMGQATGSDSITVENEGSFSTYAFVNAEGLHSFVVWDDADPPVDAVETRPASVIFRGGRFRKPVCVDIRTGNVYEIPCERHASDWTFTVPVYDSPMLIINKGSLTFNRRWRQ